MRTLLIPVAFALLATPLMARNHDRDSYDRRGESGRYGYESHRGNNRHNGMDRNRDGVVTRREWRGNDNSFYRLDRNDDGVISGSDRYRGRDDRWRAGYRDRDGYVTPREWRGSRDSFYRSDRNGNGVIEPRERLRR